MPMSLNRRLPPLNALRAFEAAARHGSFKAAAAELGVTPGAVSQQVKTLEDWLGRTLFRRLHKGLVITEAGAQLGDGLGGALDQVAAAVAEVALHRQTGAPGTQITISALPSLAEKWLMPRLARFRSRFPDVDVRLSSDEHVVDLAAEPFDFAFRYGAPAGAGYDSAALFHERIFPVCSPDLAAGPPPLDTPALLAGHTLIYDAHWRGEWQRWLEAAGAGIAPGTGSSFNRYGMAVQAAVDGLGVMIGHSVLVAADLEAGRLVAPFELSLLAASPHCLVWRRGKRLGDPQAAFRDWVLEEARASALEARLEIATDSGRLAP